MKDGHTNSECIAQKARSAKLKRPVRKFIEGTTIHLKSESKAMRASVKDQESLDQHSDNGDTAVYFSKEYASRANNHSAFSKELIIDSGSDRHICNNTLFFVGLKSIKPVGIRSVNGLCYLKAVKEGDVKIKWVDLDGQEHSITLKNVPLCNKIMANLISETRLCEAGHHLKADSSHPSFKHDNGEQLQAVTSADWYTLWKVQVSGTSPSLACLSNSSLVSAKSYFLHQHLAQIHSSAIRRFCVNDNKIAPCTSCIVSKSTRKPFKDVFPR